MSRIRQRLLGGAVLVAVVGLAWDARPGQAQGEKSVDIYSGGAAGAEGVKLGGWGSGLAESDPGQKTTGEASIKVTTNGFYAGARIQFEEPRDITTVKNDPYGFIEFVCKFQPGTARPTNTQGGPGGAGAPGGAPGTGDSSAGGAGFGAPGMGGPGAPGMGTGGGEQTLSPDTKFVKVVLVCEGGTYVASSFPNLMIPGNIEGWYSLALPFVKFAGIDQAQTAKLKEIRIFGNAKDSFWIGEIRTTTDEEPIEVDALDSQEVSVGDVVEFRASATGGLSPLRYSWDFDKSDGLQEDAVGQVVYKPFFKPSPDTPGRPGEPQPFLVTLTVRDISDAKKPVRRECEIIVNR